MHPTLWGSRALPPLRNYQTDAIEGLREKFRGGHRHVVLCAPTGSGKTVLAAHMMTGAVQKGQAVGFLTERRVLAQQAHAYLTSYRIDAGLMMGAQTSAKASSSAILVASQQTLTKRGFQALEGRRLIVVDEAHIQQKAVTAWLTTTRYANPERIVIGLTATPFPLWMARFWDDWVQAETTNALIAQGHLVRPDIWVAKATFDMKGARKSAGEWIASEAEHRGQTILGDIVQTWKAKTAEYWGGPVKTLLFSPTRNYGLQLVEEFKALGLRFVYVGDRDGLSESARLKVMQDFRDGKIMGLISCEALGRGLDVPDVLCSVHARPRRASISAHLQETGRILRPAPGKDRALIIDHCENFPRFRDDTADFWENGFPGFSEYAEKWEVRKESLDHVKPDATCSKCGFVMMERTDECPMCGEPVRKAAGIQDRQKVEVVQARLEEFQLGKANAETEEKIYLWEQIVAIAVKRGKDKNWAMAQYRKAMGDWPPKSWRAASEIDPTIEKWVWKRFIAWVQSRHIARKKMAEKGAKPAA